MMKVTIKRIDQSLPLPKYASSGACAFDIYSREERMIQPKFIDLVPSNLIIEVPTDHALVIAPRSSLARKKGLIVPNSIGIIDQDYHGENDEILIQVQNITENPVVIERGERIAQGFFVMISTATWMETKKMKQDSRGGFGSTGGYK